MPDNPEVEVHMVAAGLVRMAWAEGTHITGELARGSLAIVEDLVAGREHAVLVDVSGIVTMDRDARMIFGNEGSATRVAILGRSAVSRVVANFALGANPIPARYFTSETEAMTWLLEGRAPMIPDRGPGPIDMTTHTLATPEVDLVYDVHGPLPTADGRPPLVMIGQPMDATGFTALRAQFPDRTVVTYDPRGLGRSTRKDGRVDQVPEVQAADVHGLVQALGAGPVELFASSGGAVTALALVAAYPDDVTVLVAHEPPLIPVLPDAAAAERAQASFREAYQAKGSGAGMAAFIAMTSWQGEYTDEFFARPAPDPAAFGLPTEDDGSRDDPLLSDRAAAITAYRPDVEALAAAPTRVVIAVGEESLGTFTGRAAVATAALLGQEATVFPSHHGGFLGGEFGYAGQPEAFAARLREVLDGA